MSCKKKCEPISVSGTFMKLQLFAISMLLLVSCARMGENAKSSNEAGETFSSSEPRGTKSDAEALARAKAAAYCRERGFSSVGEIEMHTTVSDAAGPKCQTVKVPCPPAKNSSQDTRPGKMCLEHQCAERSRGWVTHLLFECR